MKSYGRAPTFLMATGYEQVRSIAAALAGDIAAADAVELELPETGVCSTSIPHDVEVDGEVEDSCCGAPGPVPQAIGSATGHATFRSRPPTHWTQDVRGAGGVE
jgi:hypothetical protein